MVLKSIKKPKKMKGIILNICICMVVFSAFSQDGWKDIISMEMPEDLRITCMLWQLGKYAETQPQNAIEKANNYRMLTRPDQKINAEIVYMSNTKIDIDRNFLSNLGFEIGSTWRNRANVWLSAEELIPCARKLTNGYMLMHTLSPLMDDQGPGLMNSQDFIDHGADGTGMRLAVIDRGYEELANAQGAGAAPAVTSYNWTSGTITGSTPHGTGCLETMFDHAPGATYFIHRVNTLTDLGQAVDKAIDDNVDIITHSLPWYNTGWYDGEGAACAAVGDAISDGMLFFTSAGNRNGTHWQGNLSDSDGDDWHQWSGSDEQNNFTVNDGGEVYLSLQWSGDPPDPIYDDYDLYLYRTSNDAVLASSTSGWSFEDIVWENETGGSLDVYLAVKQDGDHNNTFEVFNHDSGCTDFQYASSTSSTTSPSNSTSSNCISVGAVPRGSYTSPPLTSGIIASYSSRGPTNGGALTPDIVAPTNTTTVAYAGNFGGTSCATPNAAGMAAAFWSEHDYLSATGVRRILFRQAYLFNDWGDAGNDFIYGRGGFEIADWINFSRFILYGGGNTTGTSTLPYSTIEQADAFGPTGATMIFLGETIPAPPAVSNVMNKAMLYVSPIKDSTVK
jgi:hypothetical protein